MKLSARQIVSRVNLKTASIIMEGYHMVKTGNDNIGYHGAELNEYHFITKYGTNIPKSSQIAIIKALGIDAELVRFNGANMFVIFNIMSN